MLREFFVNEYPKFLFKPFGLIHNIFSLTTLIILITIYIKRNNLSKIKNKYKILEISSYILLINMVIYTFGNLYFHSFNYKENLPLHLCFIANYMFIYAILFKKYDLLKYIFFLSFIGPTAAILWPDLVSTIDNYNFWQLIISHHFFIIISLFSYYALNYKIYSIHLIKSILLIYVLMLIIYPFNILFNMNYIFTTKIPDNVTSLYPFLEGYSPSLIIGVFSAIYGIIIYNLIVVRRNKELTMA